MLRLLRQWVLGSLLIAAIGVIAVRAQTPSRAQPLFARTGMSADEDLGTVVSGAGDADGDFFGDVLIGSDSLLQVFGGDRGKFLYSISADRSGDFLRARALHVEDLDNDKRDDLVVGAPFADVNGLTDAGAVYIFSGKTGRRLQMLFGQTAHGYFGASVAFLRDVTGDRLPDLAVGEPLTSVAGATETGAVYIVSLAGEGQRIQTVEGRSPGGQFGSAIADVGDLNGDGRTDFAVGAPLGGPQGAGEVLFVSGADGRILGSLPGTGPDAHLGASLANAGDIDGDGQPDLLIGEPGAEVSGLQGAGRVIVFSRRSGRKLLELTGLAAGEGFGTVVAGGADFNGDGHPDIIVGMPGASVNGLRNAGRVRIYSSLDKQLLFDQAGKTEGDLLGFATAFAGDVSGDGRADVVIGAPRVDAIGVQNAGQAIVISLPGV